ncbi:MAG: hypothetical protein MUC37_03205 [Hyphomicrobium sp.]|jgi:hypothetical protein|nr:hypothetical protein [Hyphomicrobium sp.]
MSLAALPLTIIPFILYNVFMLTGVDLSTPLVENGITMISGGVWKFTWGDLLLLIGVVMLFIEIVKATYTGTASMIDHGLSMLVFIAFLVQFLLVNQAASSVFFLLMMMAMIDVIAGFTIGIRVAKRDIGFGADQ